MHESTDFSKIKLISNSIKEITWDTSDENDKKLDELLPDKDKLFIVVYLDVRKLSSSNAQRMFHFWKDYMDTNFDDSVRNIIIPSDENRIEFFSLQNAKTMDLEQLIELQKRLENKNNSDEREEGKNSRFFLRLGNRFMISII